jgi:hypothetical protein
MAQISARQSGEEKRWMRLKHYLLNWVSLHLFGVCVKRQWYYKKLPNKASWTIIRIIMHRTLGTLRVKHFAHAWLRVFFLLSSRVHAHPSATTRRASPRTQTVGRLAVVCQTVYKLESNLCQNVHRLKKLTPRLSWR